MLKVFKTIDMCVVASDAKGKASKDRKKERGEIDCDALTMYSPKPLKIWTAKYALVSVTLKSHGKKNKTAM